MTLISSPTPLTPLYNYPCINTPSEDNYSISNVSGLSWLQPATAPTSTSSQKYRTLASIRSQALQQNLYNLDTPPVSPLSPSIKPSPLDSFSYEQHGAVQSHTLRHTQNETSPAITAKPAHNITSAIQDMDNSHGTCFLSWIHNPANLDYISLRLRPLCLEYPLVDVANVLRWVGADWSSADCKALFRAVTQSWDQGKRRMLAFLLIRDEEMRQKAKSKLAEFAQKSKAKSQLRRPVQSQPQQQQHRQQQYNYNRQLHSIQSTVRNNMTENLSNMTTLNLSVDSVVVGSVGSVDMPSIKPGSLADIAVASIITGIDCIEPSILAQDSLTCATKATIRQHRYSPY